MARITYTRHSFPILGKFSDGGGGGGVPLGFESSEPVRV